MEAATLTRASGRRAPRAHVALRQAAATAAPLVAITALGAVLRLWAFDRVPRNAFYDAAAHSMSLSWHNFFFGAFEPGGQASIDKAPADLWLQVASFKLFGFTPVATRLPEVTAAIIAIPLLYALVRRLFGHRAGLAAAAALAVLPISVLTAHSDTMDSVMMALNVSAAWLVVVGAQSRKAWPIVAAGAVMGLAFNVKLFEALIVLPALGLFIVLAVDLPRRRRLLAFAGSLAAFAAVSLSWIVTASLTPLSGRPWPIGSKDGSIWSVVFGFNGLDRLRTPPSPAALAQDPPGVLRFFHGQQGYATAVGTMLLAALVLGVTATAVTLARRPRGGGPRLSRLQLAGVIFLGTWLILGVGLMSHMGRLQPRYLEAVSPAIAAVVGVGLVRLVSAAREPGRLASVPLVAAVGVAAVGAIVLVSPPAWAVIAAVAAVAGCGLAAGRLAGPGRGRSLTVLGLVAVLAVPAAGAASVARQHKSDAGLPLRTPPAQMAALSGYLRAHQGSARYEFASPTSFRASPLIIQDGRPVLLLTSLYKRPLVTGAQLQHLVATSQVRYALLGRVNCGPTTCTDAVRWAHAHSRDVSSAAGQPPGTVYRLLPAPGGAGGR
ncbi:MAG: hypothetical protein QOG15_1271 [Solirubrobacteraceae bacterium]|jgi:4-amino-4-deoxy-L-arabinose transferase-like glycosyltransferase|nr:hypothetical protein [Solirubrobacteraceae bacterium]